MTFYHINRRTGDDVGGKRQLGRFESKYQQLPSRIAAVAFGTVIVFLIAFLGSIFWMAKALDSEASRTSTSQIKASRANLLSRTRMITLDYSNWDAAVTAMRLGDLPWLLENIGSAALIGEAVQLTDMWGGTLLSSVGWISGGSKQYRSDVLDENLRVKIESQLSNFKNEALKGIEFFSWKADSIYVISASPFAIVYGASPISSGSDDGQLVMGLEITDDVTSRIADNYQLEGVKILREPQIGRPSIPLAGLDGEPVAYISWVMPRPGTQMLIKMIPFLTIVLLLSISLATVASRMVRANAKNLVEAERLASIAAKTDSLTGLPNRAAFYDAISQKSAIGHRAILFLDLNGFKKINDNAGHAAGDQIIISLSHRLHQCMQPDCVLARISGDEFALMVSGPNTVLRVSDVIHDIEKVFDKPFVAFGREMLLHSAIGYAVQEENDVTGEELIRQADLAMYEAKNLRLRHPVKFCSRLKDVSNDTFAIEQALRIALADPSDLSIAYQPIVGLDGKLVRAEALARWTPDGLGSVSPTQFIGIAEQAGLMVELGTAILRKICYDLEQNPSLNVSVNVSPSQLAVSTFLQDMLDVLAIYHIAPGRIQLELTESVLVGDTDKVNELLEQLRDSGFSIALDDFGTGYSSISYLDRLTISTLKIDRSFAEGIRTSTKRLALVDSMIKMAHVLDLTVVCEGVETKEDFKLLESLNCDLIQGYYFDKPMDIDTLNSRWFTMHSETAAA